MGKYARGEQEEQLSLRRKKEATHMECIAACLRIGQCSRQELSRKKDRLPRINSTNKIDHLCFCTSCNHFLCQALKHSRIRFRFRSPRLKNISVIEMAVTFRSEVTKSECEVEE